MTEQTNPFATMPADRPPVNRGNKTKGAGAGRWATFNAFMDGIAGTLSPAAALTWLLLFRDTKRNGLARTSQTDLARRAGVSDRAIRDALAELRGRGLLDVVRRGGIGRGPSVYRVTLAATTKRK